MANIRYLFSSLNVRMIDATVNLLTFGWTRWLASLMVIPCTRTWSTSVARISSGTNVFWPLPLPLPLPLSLCLPPLSALSPLGSILILMGVSSILVLSVNMHNCVLIVFSLWQLELIILRVCVFWMRTWLNLCKMRTFCNELCRRYWENWNLCENRWIVFRVLRNVSMFQELNYWFGKLGQLIQ